MPNANYPLIPAVHTSGRHGLIDDRIALWAAEGWTPDEPPDPDAPTPLSDFEAREAERENARSEAAARERAAQAAKDAARALRA